MASSSFDVGAAVGSSSALGAAGTSSTVGMDASILSLAPHLSSGLLNKTVTVELLSGHRITGRLATCDPQTLNLSVDFIKKTEVKVTVPCEDHQSDDDTIASKREKVEWIPNPREFKYLQTIFIRGSSIKFIDFDVDAAHNVLSSYPTFRQ